MVNYEKGSFGAGLMLSKIVPSTNQITIYNANPATRSMEGIEFYTGDKDSASTCSATGTLAYRQTKTINCGSGTLNDNDSVRMHDRDPTDTDNNVGDGDYDYAIDAVCWNDDGATMDSECDETTDVMVKAGLWTHDTAVDGTNGQTYQLVANGNNDEAVNDWEAIPEFGTLLMPIASVLLIVGYNYRRKENKD